MPEDGRERRLELSSPITDDQPLGERRQARELIKRPRVLFAIVSATLLLVALAVVLAVFLSKRQPSGYSCISEYKVNGAAATDRKGLAVDDVTFLRCPGKIPATWPNADAGMASIRLFKAWDSSWPADQQQGTWQAIVDFAKQKQAKVLVGTQITCSEQQDDTDWANVLSLLKMLGSDHVMGVAVGNELELLHQKDKKIVPQSCIDAVWKGGYFLRKFNERAQDLDRLSGFGNVPLTSAFGGAILAGDPFVNTPDAMVLDFVQKVTAKYGKRWVYSINIYPYFDPSNNLDPGSKDSCTQALGHSQCWSNPTQCLFPGIVKTTRDRMQRVSPGNDVLWITETGWSSPMASTLSDKPIHACPAFSDQESLRSYYEGFLSWDMKVEGTKGPDHVFYFTVRDSANFGMEEYFGLIHDCDSSTCKLQHTGGSPSPGPSPSPAPGPPGPAACSAYESCKGLHGNCCPTDTGVRLGCCPRGEA